MNKNHAPLISVVIPTYNHAHYLSRAMQSILDQTYIKWEAIVVDNYSTDNTAEVMESFIDPRIIYLKIHNNGIIAASRNMGIHEAKGEWIAFLDSDDWWTIDKLQICVNCMEDQVDLIYHDLKIVTDTPRPFRSKVIRSWQVKSPVLIDLIVRGNAIATSSVIVRKKLLNHLNGMNENPDMVASEDYNTWLRISQLTDNFKYISKQLGFYQLHNQGISRRDMSVPVQHAATEFIDLLNPQQKNKFEAGLNYTRGRFNYLEENYDIAKKYLLSVVKHCDHKFLLKTLWMITAMYFYKKKQLAFNNRNNHEKK